MLAEFCSFKNKAVTIAKKAKPQNTKMFLMKELKSREESWIMVEERTKIKGRMGVKRVIPCTRSEALIFWHQLYPVIVGIVCVCARFICVFLRRFMN